jgi:hypothetical protein
VIIQDVRIIAKEVAEARRAATILLQETKDMEKAPKAPHGSGIIVNWLESSNNDPA